MATMIRKQHTAMTTGWTTGEYVRTAASSSLEEKRERGEQSFLGRLFVYLSVHPAHLPLPSLIGQHI